MAVNQIAWSSNRDQRAVAPYPWPLSSNKPSGVR